MNEVFETVDTSWRGIGTILKSGFKIQNEFERFDAQKMIEFSVPESKDPKGCACGEILTGVIIPPQCSLYKSLCTPINPVGPCMVSSEGTCAAYYRYHRDHEY
jgi:hydrogenase expression/formation protein HypD